MPRSRHEAGEVVAFWVEAGPEAWFRRDADFDERIRSRYRALHEEAARGELAGWDEDPQSALALLLLLDQFPRNMFRGEPRAYATDALALGVAERAVARGFDRAYEADLRTFFYLPWMHSEELAHQERCLAESAALGGETLKAAIVHRDLIARFGRFPHRNAIFNRASTPEEEAYLATPEAFRG